jgi:hypothetical protein
MLLLSVMLIDNWLTDGSTFSCPPQSLKSNVREEVDCHRTDDKSSSRLIMFSRAKETFID